MTYDKDFEELDAELAGINYGEEFDHDMEDSDSDEGIAAPQQGPFSTTVESLAADMSKKYKPWETKSQTMPQTFSAGKTTPQQPEPQTDPYGNTAKVAEKVYGSFSDTLRDMYAKREKAREKRKRTAEKVAVGHALGDLFGAISAHYISGQKNSRAVVPQSLAPKSYAKIQALIDEGVADQNTFDKYMLSLTQEKGKHDINVAQARDKAAVDLAMQKRKEDEAERERQAKAAENDKQMKWKAEQARLNRESQETIAKLRAQWKDNSTSTTTKSGKGSEELPDWKLRMALLLMPPTTKTTRIEQGNNGLPDKTSTTESRFKATKQDMANFYAKANGIAKDWKLSEDETGADQFAELYSLMKTLVNKYNLTEEQAIAKIAEARTNKSVDDIIEFFNK